MYRRYSALGILLVDLRLAASAARADQSISVTQNVPVAELETLSLVKSALRDLLEGVSAQTDSQARPDSGKLPEG
jgi:hypothetical protein